MGRFTGARTISRNYPRPELTLRDLEVGVVPPDQDTWYFKAGLRERWTPLGHTVLYCEYEQVENAFSNTNGDFDLWAWAWCRKSTLLPCRLGSLLPQHRS